jgi:hypothetical protein
LSGLNYMKKAGVTGMDENVATPSFPTLSHKRQHEASHW